MSTKLPQWTGTHLSLKTGDLRAGCRSGIEQHAAYVGGAKMIMAACLKPTPFMIATYARLVSLCQCTSCVVRRLRKEHGSPRRPRNLVFRVDDVLITGKGLRKLNPKHALGCLIRKPCKACKRDYTPGYIAAMTREADLP